METSNLNKVTENSEEKNKNSRLDFIGWAKVIGATIQEVQTAWDELKDCNVVSEAKEKVIIFPEAMTRAKSDLQRKLASFLSGYELTENSYIVRKAGKPPGSPTILNTRITVEYIANYFRQGWGIIDIRRDLPQLTPEQIEAAVQYYLNNREEIERDIQQGIEIYEQDCRRQGNSGIWKSQTTV
ncbi:MAG: DUF433 domain-containing protein [bacterium]